MALRALIDGSYFGVIHSANKDNFVLIDLPGNYCRSRFKDYAGNDIVEFDVTYFYTISEGTARKTALESYPK